MDGSLPLTIHSISGLLCRRVYHIELSHGVESVDLWLDISKRLEDWRITFSLLRVVQLVLAHGLAKLSGVSNTEHEMGLGGRVWLLKLCNKGFQLAGETWGEVIDTAAPEWTLLEGADVVASHHAKVVAAATKSDQKIGVLVLIGVDNVAGSKYNLVVDYVVGYKTFTGGEERKSTCDLVSPTCQETLRGFYTCLPETVLRSHLCRFDFQRLRCREGAAFYRLHPIALQPRWRRMNP